MKSVSIAILLTLLMTVQPFAQQLTDAERAEHVRKGTRKITIGLMIMAAGALTLPFTVVGSGDGKGSAMNASVAAIFLGGGMAWWGASERRRALQPQTGIGFSFGRAHGVRVVRTW